MKKVGIVTIIDNDNYGNRLQNYALEKFLSKNFDVQVTTLINYDFLNDKKFYFLRKFKNFIRKMKKSDEVNYKRFNNFSKFNKNITFSKKIIDCKSDLNEYDYSIVGSDQVWNPNFRRLRDVDLLKNIDKSKRISYAASFGVSNLEKKHLKKLKYIENFKAVSVREFRAKELILENIKYNDVCVLIDPTLLLSCDEWKRVTKKPDLKLPKKYILNYFLGEISDFKYNEIKRVAEENDCDIINVMDKNSEFYTCGPSEFLYLEMNAFLICTDSFHSSVFAFIFNKPFIIFERDQSGMISMNSRLETLLEIFKLKNRRFNNKSITEKNLNYDYSSAYEILKKEQKKSFEFLCNALDIKE